MFWMTHTIIDNLTPFQRGVAIKKETMGKKISGREKALDKLLADRLHDMVVIFEHTEDPNEVIRRLEAYRGIKKFYYTLIFMIETFLKDNKMEKHEAYKKNFEYTMAQWTNGVLGSNFLARLSEELLKEEGFI
jgi:hypothetical protein